MAKRVNTTDMICQLSQALHVACGWMSDGSSSKTIDEAKLVSVDLSERGLKLSVKTSDNKQRIVSWRVPRTQALDVIEGVERVATAD